MLILGYLNLCNPSFHSRGHDWGVRMDVAGSNPIHAPQLYIYYVGCPWLMGSCMSPQTQKVTRADVLKFFRIVQGGGHSFSEVAQTLAEEFLRWKEGMRSMPEGMIARERFYAALEKNTYVG